MKLTKKKTIKLFREHWKWLAETGSNSKEDWPGYNFDNPIESDCFLCEYAGQHPTGHYCGDNCLIAWSGMDCEVGEFGKWCDAKTVRIRKKYAKIISELPER